MNDIHNQHVYILFLNISKKKRSLSGSGGLIFSQEKLNLN